MTTIRVRTWGRLGIGTIAVRVADGEAVADAVARSITRRTGLAWCGGPRSDGTALDDSGRPASYHWCGTLGRPCAGGGWTPEGAVWFAIPAVTP